MIKFEGFLHITLKNITFPSMSDLLGTTSNHKVPPNLYRVKNHCILVGILIIRTSKMSLKIQSNLDKKVIKIKYLSVIYYKYNFS